MNKDADRRAAPGSSSLLLLLICASGTASGQSIPIASSLYDLRQQVNPNDANVPSGDIIQLGAYCVTAGSNPCNQLNAGQGVSGTALQGQASLTMSGADDALNPNHLVANTNYSPALAGAWTLHLVDSAGSADYTTPTLFDTNGFAAPVVDFASSVGFSVGSNPLSPTMSWTEPPTFMVLAGKASGGGGLRIQIRDLDPGGNAPPLQIFAGTVPFTGSSSYSFTIPQSFVTNGVQYSLQIGHPYSIEIQNILFRVPGGGTGNPNIFARSRAFFDYTPVDALPAGVSNVQLPTVSVPPAGGDPVYAFDTPVVASEPAFIQAPIVLPITKPIKIQVGPDDPPISSIESPISGALEGSKVYRSIRNGTFTGYLGTFSGTTPITLPAGGVPSFILAPPGGGPLALRAAAAGTNPTPVILGLTFTANGKFTGTLATAGDDTAGSSDGPLPLWALGALGAGLYGVARRRLSRPQQLA